MPRVTSHTARHSTKMRRCKGCGQEIEYGDKYYLWEKRQGGPQFRHTGCGYPKPTELSNKKTAQIEEEVQDADFSKCETEEDCKNILESIASIARDVASEYEESLGNMPEGLQQGSTGEAMQMISEELESWAGTVEGWDWGGDEEEEGWQDAMREEAQAVLEDLPEYQG